MKTILSKAIRYDVDTPPAEPAPAAPAEPAPGLPPKAAAPPTDGLPPKEPNAPPADVITYDIEKDTAGLKGLDMKGEKILGKFDGVEDLMKSYGELESFKGKKSEDLAKELGYFPPETYEFGDAGKEWDTETSAAVAESFKDMGLSQAQAEKAIPHMMELGQELATALGKQELMDAWNLTGEAFKARESAVASWAQGNVPDDIYSALEKLGAGGMLAAEAMMRSNQERPLWTGQEAGIDLNDIQQQITDVEASMKAEETGSAKYKSLEKQRQELYRKKNPPKS